MAKWASALIELLSDSDEVQKMGMAGRKIVENNFSTAVIAPKLAGYLGELI